MAHSSGRYFSCRSIKAIEYSTAGHNMPRTRVLDLARNSILTIVDRRRSAFMGQFPRPREFETGNLGRYQYFRHLHASSARPIDPLNVDHMETVRVHPPRHVCFNIHPRNQWFMAKSPIRRAVHPAYSPILASILTSPTVYCIQHLICDQDLILTRRGRQSLRAQGARLEDSR